jgi:hypothetical protein
MTTRLESDIDDLYRLPLEAFTKARNRLAKAQPGDDKARVSGLVKPSLAMWIINQLYWHEPSIYRALVDASEKLRSAHLAALNGKKVETGKFDQLHKTTVQKALAKIVAFAENNGTTLTDAVRESIRRTLTALPGEEPPGRLTREPMAAGFSLLAGVKPRPAPQLSRKKAEVEKRQKEAERQAREAEVRALKEQEKRDREIRKAEEALCEAERRLAALKR